MVFFGQAGLAWFRVSCAIFARRCLCSERAGCASQCPLWPTAPDRALQRVFRYEFKYEFTTANSGILRFENEMSRVPLRHSGSKDMLAVGKVSGRRGRRCSRRTARGGC
jgi:hypothetical protein